jgi:myo-inositol-1(or 4)-monophosphatase
MALPGAPEADWLAFSRRAADAGRAALEGFPRTAERARKMGRGEGGDMTLAIDAAVEDALFAELEQLGVGLCAVSEERGLVEIGGGGPVRVVIDPIDGSLNAKRNVPLYSLSIAVAEGEDMAAVTFGYVTNFPTGEEWWALRGQGAWCDGERLEPAADASLEILGIESANPRLVSAAADAIAETNAHRLRMVGSIALSLCYVASARFDGMLSLRPIRSVDAAGGQLIVREAGGSVSFPDTGEAGPLGAGLGLDMRSRVAAASTETILDGLVAVMRKVQG